MRYGETFSPDYDEPEDEARAFGEDNGRGSGPSSRSSAVLARVPSGSQRLTLAAGSTSRTAATVAQLARWLADDADARALVLYLDVRSTSTPTDATPFAAQDLVLAQGSGTAQGTGTETGGVIRLTYGAANVQRVVELDMRAGTYQLPPCALATVDAFLYLNGPRTVNIAAALVPGTVDTPTRATNTLRTTLVAGATAAIQVPFGARWVSLSGGGPTNIGASQPAVSLAQTSGPLILQDYANGNFTAGPGALVELASRADLTLSNLGTAAATFTTRFLLEL